MPHDGREPTPLRVSAVPTGGNRPPATVFCLITQGEFTRNLIVQPPASDAVPPASQIREAMVKMLSCPPAVGQPPPQALPARGGPFDQLVPRGGLNASSVGGRQFPKDLSTCVFWSSVGLGALVKGNPVESVRTLHQQFSVSPLSFAGKRVRWLGLGIRFGLCSLSFSHHCKLYFST